MLEIAGGVVLGLIGLIVILAVIGFVLEELGF